MSGNESTFALRKIYLFPILHLPSNAWLLSYERTETFIQVLLYVNSIEKWTGMKNNGLKMQEADQIYV